MKCLLVSILSILMYLTSFAQEKYVLMVSFDGFRYDFVEKYNLPHFKILAETGASTPRMIPSFPSKTFPNHYSIVTGLYPGNHGLVDNKFYDSEKDQIYSNSNLAALRDPYYYGGLPLWQLAQQHGMKSASYFWVGSEAPVAGSFPDYYLPYKHDEPNENRIEAVFNWLDLPEDERPNLVTMYFSIVDSKGHDFGPESKENEEAAIEADSLLGIIMDNIEIINLPINLIVVSDHGMYKMDGNYIDFGDLMTFSRNQVKIINNSTHIHIYPTDSTDITSIYSALKKQENHFKVYLRKDIPAELNYSQSNRIGDIFLAADPGYDFKKPQSTNYGVHGYDPYLVKEMGAIFYAAGPDIKKGYTIEPFRNVNVYPFVAILLGIKPPPSDGDPEILRPILQNNPK